MGFGDFDTAIQARETLTRLMISVLDQERPPYRYGTVISIDPDNRFCTVRFPGGATDGSNDVKVRLGGIQPSVPGQTVRVAGQSGDNFVSDVIGHAVLTTTTDANLPVPTGVVLTSSAHLATVSWNDVSTADAPVAQYEVEFAESADFLTNPQSYTTTSRIFYRPYSPGISVWARVRSLNGQGGSSAWGASVPATTIIADYPASGTATDGSVPGMAPQPVITQGLGFLAAQWVPMVNADPVTYEVHISTVTGFATSSATKLGETGSTFYIIDSLPSGAGLVYGTRYYVRLIAKDGDGPGPAGPQANGVPQQVELGDVGNVPSSAISDGVRPSTSPGAPTLKAGIGFLYAKWTHISNADQATYEVHVGTSSSFIPDANSYVAETTSNFAFIRSQGAGTSYAPLAYGTTYYVKLWAKDLDGYAPNAGAGTAGVTVQADTPDLKIGAITVGSGIIGNLAVDTAQIADLAISTAKIKLLNVDTAQIANGAITDLKVTNVTADKIDVGNLKVSVQLTTGSLRTSATFPRVELTSAGLKAYNGAGSPTVQINSDGSASFTGVVNITAAGSNVPGSAVTGTVPAATSATTVPGSGVTGTVASATSATTVPGTGVTGTVANATNATNVPAAGVTSGALGAGVSVPTGNLTGTALGGDNLQTRSRPDSQPDPIANQGIATHAVAGSFGSAPAWQITIPSVPTSAYHGTTHTDRIPVQPSTTYTASVWLYVATANLQVRLRITTEDGSFGYVGEPGVDAAPPANTWTRVAFTFTTPSNVSYVQFSTQFPYNSGTWMAGTYYLYGFQVQTGSVITGYNPSVIEAGRVLQGGGSAYGLTTISGRLTVGAETGKHVTIGSGDGKGTNGLRMFDNDGTTVLIDLNISGTPTIFSAIINAGSITGATLATSNTYPRVRVFGTGYVGQGLVGTGDPAQVLLERSATAGDFAQIWIPQTDATLELWGHGGDGSIEVGTTLNFDTTGATNFNGGSSIGAGVTISSAGNVFAGSGQFGLNIGNSATKASTMITSICTSGTITDVEFNYNSTVTLTSGSWLNFHVNGIYMVSINGGTKINAGTKTFVIDHPTDKSRYLVHAAVEGPSNDAYYRGRAKLVKGLGTAVVKLPAYFTALCDETTATLVVTPIAPRVHHHGKNPLKDPCHKYGRRMADGTYEDCHGHTVVPNLVATAVENGEFHVGRSGGYSEGDTDQCDFDWLVIAKRKDVPDLVVEPKRSEVTLKGDGPYKYLVAA